MLREMFESMLEYTNIGFVFQTKHETTYSSCVCSGSFSLT
jgi:hypothetical protein